MNNSFHYYASTVVKLNSKSKLTDFYMLTIATYHKKALQWRGTLALSRLKKLLIREPYQYGKHKITKTSATFGVSVFSILIYFSVPHCKRVWNKQGEYFSQIS